MAKASEHPSQTTMGKMMSDYAAALDKTTVVPSSGARPSPPTTALMKLAETFANPTTQANLATFIKSLPANITPGIATVPLTVKGIGVPIGQPQTVSGGIKPAPHRYQIPATATPVAKQPQISPSTIASPMSLEQRLETDPNSLTAQEAAALSRKDYRRWEYRIMGTAEGLALDAEALSLRGELDEMDYNHIIGEIANMVSEHSSKEALARNQAAIERVMAVYHPQPQISPVAKISEGEVSVPTPTPEIASQIAPVEVRAEIAQPSIPDTIISPEDIDWGAWEEHGNEQGVITVRMGKREITYYKDGIERTGVPLQYKGEEKLYVLERVPKEELAEEPTPPPVAEETPPVPKMEIPPSTEESTVVQPMATTMSEKKLISRLGGARQLLTQDYRRIFKDATLDVGHRALIAKNGQSLVIGDNNVASVLTTDETARMLGTTITNTAPPPAGLTSSGEGVTPMTSDVPSYSGSSPMSIQDDELGQKLSPFEETPIEETLKAEELPLEKSIEDLIVAIAKNIPSYRKATLIGNVMDALEADLARTTDKKTRFDIQTKAYQALVDMGIPKEVLKPATLLKKYRELKTERGLEKFVAWVQQQYLKYDNALMIDDIVSLQEEAYHGVYATQLRDIEALMKQYRVGNLSKKHREALEDAISFLQKNPGTEISTDLLNQIAELDKTPLRGLDNDALYTLRQKLQSLIATGKQNYRSWVTRQKAERTSLTQKIVAKSKSLGGLEPLSVKGQMSRFRRGYQESVVLDKTLTPMNYLMDEIGIMDEKRGVDEKFNIFLDQLSNLTKPLKEIATRFHLTNESKRRIKIYQVIRQKRTDLLEPLLIKNNMTEAQAKSLKLTEGEELALAYMDRTYEKIYGLVADYMAENYNVLVPHVDYYAPLLADPDIMHDASVETNTIDFYYRTKNISADSTKTRHAVNYLTTSNAFSDFYGYVTDMTYMLNMGKNIRGIFEAVNSREFAAKAGPLTQGLVLDWLDTMARRGGASGQQRIWVLDILRKNTSVAYMAGKLGSFLIQLTAAADGFQVLGLKYMTEGSAMQMDDRWIEFLRRGAPEVYQDNADPDIDTGTVMKWASDKLYAPLIWMDAKVRRTVYLGSFAQWARKNGLDVETALLGTMDKVRMRQGLQFAREQTSRVQGTSAFKDQPLAISRGRLGNLNKNRSFGKAVMHFQSFNLFRWANIKDTIWTHGLRKGKVGKALGGILWLLLIAALGEALIRRGSKWVLSGGEEKSDTALWKETLRNMVESVPFIGPAMSMMMYGNDPIPVIQAITDASQGIYRTFSTKSGFGKARAVSTAIRGVGAIAGVPGSAQIGEILKYGINALEAESKKSTTPTPLPGLPKRPSIPKPPRP
jgi:hypothetical protein